MTEIIRARVLDKRHLELERDLEIEDEEIFVRIIKKGKILEPLAGAWGYEVDSKDFVSKLRKSMRMNWVK